MTDVANRRRPAEPGLWLFILLEMTTFSIFFGVIAYYRVNQASTFAAGQHHLDRGLAFANTIVLICGSLLAAYAVRTARAGRGSQSRTLLRLTAGTGLVFIAVKVFEYHRLISDGFTIRSGTFFLCFFGFTLAHLAHVLIGTSVLGFVARPREGQPSVAVVEGAAAYWHMVDVLWLILFPLLYLR